MWLRVIMAMLTLAPSAAAAATSPLARRQTAVRQWMCDEWRRDTHMEYHGTDLEHDYVPTRPTHDTRLRYPPCWHLAGPGQTMRELGPDGSNASGSMGPARHRRPEDMDFVYSHVLLLVVLILPLSAVCIGMATIIMAGACFSDLCRRGHRHRRASIDGGTPVSGWLTP